MTEGGSMISEAENQKTEDRCRNLTGDIVMRKTRENIEKMKRESLAAVHTHTH